TPTRCLIQSSRSSRRRRMPRVDSQSRGSARHQLRKLARSRSICEVRAAEQSVALDRAGITVFRDITFLAAGPASERSRSPAARNADEPTMAQHEGELPCFAVGKTPRQKMKHQ